MAQQIEQVNETLWVGQSEYMAYNSGILISEGLATLIDPGITIGEIQRLLAFIQAQNAQLFQVILTHSDWDHILGPEQMPEAVPVIAHANYMMVEDYDDLVTRMVDRFFSEIQQPRRRPFAIPIPNHLLICPHSLVMGTTTLELHEAFGHSPNQIAIYEPERKTLWAADMLSDIEIPFISDSLSAYEETLERMATLEIRALIPGHGRFTTDPAEIERRFDHDRAYLAELRQRVQAVVDVSSDMATAVAACIDMTFHHHEDSARPHQLNVETVFAELSNAADKNSVGWARAAAELNDM